MSLLRLAGLEFLAFLGLFAVSVLLLSTGPWALVIGGPLWLILWIMPGIAAFFVRRSGRFPGRGTTVAVALAAPVAVFWSLLAAQGVTSAASIAPAIFVGLIFFGGTASLEAAFGWWLAGKVARLDGPTAPEA